MRRLLVLAAILLTLVPGCQREPGVARIFETRHGYYDTEALEQYVLCGYAMDAVRLIVRELLQAPNNDAALTRQTAQSYAAYATTLRGLAERATTEDRQGLILDAADAADAFAAEVRARDHYHVDVQPVIVASQKAFPGCQLGG
jgi:hypothetical protein